MGFISLLLFLPILGSLVLLLMPKDKLYSVPKRSTTLKVIAIVFSLISFLLSLPLLFSYGDSALGFNIFKWFNTSLIVEGGTIVGFEETVSWINLRFLGIDSAYHLRLDGIGIILIVLTTFITPIVLIASWNSIKVRLKEFVICILFMEFGMLGAFMAWDLLLFYFFWELMLIPMYFIIGIWGAENKVYAAVKFFIYTMVGSLLMFLAIIYIYIEIGSFNLSVIYSQSYVLNKLFNILGYQVEAGYILFCAFALSFAIKVPIFPFHTWLPDAHVQAPTAGSVILAGVLLKMGTYGFIRFAIPFFPEASFYFAPFISVLAIIGIVYGALMALAQSDIKKLIAYSSVSHLGFVMLGLFAFSMGKDGAMLLSYQGVQGAIYQMVNHGLSTGALFLLVGMIYERRHTKAMKDFGGLARIMPLYAVIFMITTLSSIGLPGLNGFIGEFLILVGVFKSNWLFGSLGAVGIILGAVYMLILYQRIFFGECNNDKNKVLKDLSKRELLVMLPLVFMMILMGVYPNFFLDKLSFGLNNIFTMIPHVNISWLF